MKETTVTMYEVEICPVIDTDLACSEMWPGKLDLTSPPQDMAEHDRTAQYPLTRAVISCYQLEGVIRDKARAECREFKTQEGHD